MFRVFLFVLTTAVCLKAGNIEFTFANQSNTGTFYEFDIMVNTETFGTKLGDALVYLNYNPIAFGPNAAATGNIQVTKAALLEGELAGSPLYEIVNIIDNTDDRVAITIGYMHDDSPEHASELAPTPQTMLHISLAIAATSTTVDLSFENPDQPDQPTMQGQQYQSDNEPDNRYDPVLATDTDDTALNPIAVDLLSFTGTRVRSGVLIEWRTASEINLAGYNIFKSTIKENNFAKINKVIIPGAAPDPSQGASYSYIDPLDEQAVYYYKLQIVELDGTTLFHPPIRVEFTASTDENAQLPLKFKLFQNYPNPFNPGTKILYQVPSKTFVDIAVYNVHGRRIKQLVQSKQSAGTHTVLWDGHDKDNHPVGSGIYILCMKTDKFQTNRRITLLR